MTSITLYQYWRSSCSWRVRWALDLKGVAFNSVIVNLLKGEQKDAAFGQKSPTGQIPCLDIGGTHLVESLAIMEWLEETYPQNPLLPQDPMDRVEVRQLCGIIALGIQPIQNLSVLQHVSADKAERAKWARHWIEKGLAAYEKKTSTVAGTFSFGGQLSMADICLVPQVYNAHRFQVDMSKFPTVEKIYQHCLTLPSCQKAHPDQQPGAVPGAP